MKNISIKTIFYPFLKLLLWIFIGLYLLIWLTLFFTYSLIKYLFSFMKHKITEHIISSQKINTL